MSWAHATFFFIYLNMARYIWGGGAWLEGGGKGANLTEGRERIGCARAVCILTKCAPPTLTYTDLSTPPYTPLSSTKKRKKKKEDHSLTLFY